MTKIFVSYSRVDLEFTERLVGRLRRVYDLPNVWWYIDELHGGQRWWYDDELHGGQRWWQAILAQIAECDVFVYLLSNESVTSLYCQAEFTEAQRLQKPVVTVQIRDKTRLSDDLTAIQYVDMKRGLDDDTLARLIRSINEQAELPKKKRALWTPVTPLPTIPTDEGQDSRTRSDVETPTLEMKIPIGASKGDSDGHPIIIATIITGLLGILAVVVSVILPPLLNPMPTPDMMTQAVEMTFQVAQTATLPGIIIARTVTTTPPMTVSATPSRTPSITPTSTKPTASDTPSATVSATPSSTPSITPIINPAASDTPWVIVHASPTNIPEMSPTPTSTLDIVLTMAIQDAQATSYQATRNSLNVTASATNMPTPNMTASIEAYRTQQAATATQAWINSADTPTPVTKTSIPALTATVDMEATRLQRTQAALMTRIAYATESVLISQTPTATITITPIPTEIALANVSFVIRSMSGTEIGNGRLRVYYADQLTAPETARVELELSFDNYYITPTPYGPRTVVPAATSTPGSFVLTPTGILTPTPWLPRFEGTEGSVEFYELMGASLVCLPSSFSGCTQTVVPQSARRITFNGVKWGWIITPESNARGIQDLRLELWRLISINDDAGRVEVVWDYPFQIRVDRNEDWVDKILVQNTGALIAALGTIMAALIAGGYFFSKSKQKKPGQKR